MNIVFKFNEKTQKTTAYGTPFAVYQKKEKNGRIYTRVLFEDPGNNYQIGLIQFICEPPTPWGQLTSVEVDKKAYQETALFRQFPDFLFFRVPTLIARKWDNGSILPYEEMNALVRSGYISQDTLKTQGFNPI